MNDPTLSKKMRESLALNQPAESDEDSSSNSSEGGEGDYGSDSSEDGGGRPAPKKARRHSLPPPPQSMTGTTVQNINVTNGTFPKQLGLRASTEVGLSLIHDFIFGCGLAKEKRLFAAILMMKQITELKE